MKGKKAFYYSHLRSRLSPGIECKLSLSFAEVTRRGINVHAVRALVCGLYSSNDFPGHSAKGTILLMVKNKSIADTKSCMILRHSRHARDRPVSQVTSHSSLGSANVEGVCFFLFLGTSSAVTPVDTAACSSRRRGSLGTDSFIFSLRLASSWWNIINRSLLHRDSLSKRERSCSVERPSSTTSEWLRSTHHPFDFWSSKRNRLK